MRTKTLFFCFLGPYLQHTKVPRFGVSWQLQLLATATATAMPDPSCMCDLHHSSQQCRILRPLREARDQTCNLMVPSRICFHCAMMGTPQDSSVHQGIPSTLHIGRYSISRHCMNDFNLPNNLHFMQWKSQSF